MISKRGIDISSHQGDINLEALKNEIDFVIIRVGYGVSGIIDKKFQRNTELCEQLGIPYGFYWYSYALTTENAKTEASHFLNAIKPFNPTMGCWFDMEDADAYKARNGMPSNETLQTICYTFCEKVENAGYKVGIYASQNWFNTKLASDRLNKFDKWVAQWPTSNGRQKGLKVNADAKSDVAMWQFTSMGKFAGYNGNLDVNYAYKDFVNNISKPEPSIQTPEGTTFELLCRTMNDEFGSGNTRKILLGDKYDEIQGIINHIASASVDELVKETEEGRYGNGDQRKLVLGNRYNEIQTKINNKNKKPVKKTINKGSRIKFVGTKSYSGLPLASWTHNDIFNVIEVSGDRIVIGKGTVVTAAVNIKDCKLV